MALPGSASAKTRTPSGKASSSPQNLSASVSDLFSDDDDDDSSAWRSISKTRKRMDSTISSFVPDGSIFVNETKIVVVVG